MNNPRLSDNAVCGSARRKKYYSATHAQQGAVNSGRHHHKTFYYYRCTRCGYYHLTHKRPQEATS